MKPSGSHPSDRPPASKRRKRSARFHEQQRAAVQRVENETQGQRSILPGQWRMADRIIAAWREEEAARLAKERRVNEENERKLRRFAEKLPKDGDGVIAVSDYQLSKLAAASNDDVMLKRLTKRFEIQQARREALLLERKRKGDQWTVEKEKLKERIKILEEENRQVGQQSHSSLAVIRT